MKMKFSRGQNVFYNAKSGKVYPAAVVEIKRSFSRRFSFQSDSSFHYLIEIISFGISKKILCTENELQFNEEIVAIKTAAPLLDCPVPVSVKKNKIRKI
ncbi:hypothetical protein ASE21_00085 [Flavobacterium sp. Root901]|nr:hypothetical protein ASE21_00085 [Flavobacterium sp. Root901]